MRHCGWSFATSTKSGRFRQPVRSPPREIAAGFAFLMPTAAPKPCCHAGCHALVRDGSTRCTAHKVLPGRFADRQRGSRHERGYGSAWDRARARVLRRDAGICQACLADGLVHQGTEVDHKLPKSQGGTDDDSNLQTICAARHRAKTLAEAARARGINPAAEPATPGGDRISTTLPARTDRFVEFSRAQVMGIFSEEKD